MAPMPSRDVQAAHHVMSVVADMDAFDDHGVIVRMNGQEHVPREPVWQGGRLKVVIVDLDRDTTDFDDTWLGEAVEGTFLDEQEFWEYAGLTAFGTFCVITTGGTGLLAYIFLGAAVTSWAFSVANLVNEIADPNDETTSKWDEFRKSDTYDYISGAASAINLANSVYTTYQIVKYTPVLARNIPKAPLRLRMAETPMQPGMLRTADDIVPARSALRAARRTPAHGLGASASPAPRSAAKSLYDDVADPSAYPASERVRDFITTGIDFSLRLSGDGGAPGGQADGAPASSKKGPAPSGGGAPGVGMDARTTSAGERVADRIGSSSDDHATLDLDAEVVTFELSIPYD